MTGRKEMKKEQSAESTGDWELKRCVSGSIAKDARLTGCWLPNAAVNPNYYSYWRQKGD